MNKKEELILKNKHKNWVESSLSFFDEFKEFSVFCNSLEDFTKNSKQSMFLQLQNSFEFEMPTLTMGQIDKSKHINFQDIKDTSDFCKFFMQSIKDKYISILVIQEDVCILKMKPEDFCQNFQKIFNLSSEIYICDDNFTWTIESLAFEDRLTFFQRRVDL